MITKQQKRLNPSVTSPTSQLILQPFPSLHLRHSSFYNPSVASLTSRALHLRHLASRPWKLSNKTTEPLPSLHLRHSLFSSSFRRFTYVTAHSTTLPLLHLRHGYFTYVTYRAVHYKYATKRLNSSVASPTSHLILQPVPSLHLRHSSFYNPFVALPTSQALHVLHLANRPWIIVSDYMSEFRGSILECSLEIFLGI